MVLLYGQRPSYLGNANKEARILPIDTNVDKYMDIMNTANNTNTSNSKKPRANTANWNLYQSISSNDLSNPRHIPPQQIYTNQLYFATPMNSSDSNHLSSEVYPIHQPNSTFYSSYNSGNNNNSNSNNTNLNQYMRNITQAPALPSSATSYYPDITRPSLFSPKINIPDNHNSGSNLATDSKLPLSRLPTMLGVNTNTPYSNSNPNVSFSSSSESSYYNTQSNANLRRCSLIYPMTPQTMISQQTGQSSPILPKNDGFYYHHPYGNGYVIDNNIKEDTNYGATKDGDINADNNGSRKANLYYDRTSKNYIFKTDKEAREGLSNNTLIKHTESGGNGNKRKKVSYVDTTSEKEDEEDDEHSGSDFEGSSCKKANKSLDNSKSKRSRNGCLTCRQRKKRCCETKPKCSECVRLNLNCRWPEPGNEHKNRSKHNQYIISNDEMHHETYGIIKVLRGVVEYKIEP